MDEEGKVFTCPYCNQIKSEHNRARHLKDHGIQSQGRGRPKMRKLEQITSKSSLEEHQSQHQTERPVFSSSQEHKRNEEDKDSNSGESEQIEDIPDKAALQRKHHLGHRTNKHFKKMQNTLNVLLDQSNIISEKIDNIGGQAIVTSGIDGRQRQEATTIGVSWNEAIKRIKTKSTIQKLKAHTIENYVNVYKKLRKHGFQPINVATQESLEKIYLWIQKKESRCENIYYAALHKLKSNCFPKAPVEFPRVPIEQHTRISPPYEDIIKKLRKMIDDGKDRLALTSLFLLMTGLRISEALRCPMKLFEESRCISNFVQAKSRDKRPFVIITEKFMKYAKSMKWEGLEYGKSWLNKQLKPYKMSCHLFRHGYASRRDEFDPSSVKKITKALGHSSERVTKRYIHAKRDKELNIIDSAFDVDLKFNTIN